MVDSHRRVIKDYTTEAAVNLRAHKVCVVTKWSEQFSSSAFCYIVRKRSVRSLSDDRSLFVAFATCYSKKGYMNECIQAPQRHWHEDEKGVHYMLFVWHFAQEF